MVVPNDAFLSLLVTAAEQVGKLYARLTDAEAVKAICAGLIASVEVR